MVFEKVVNIYSPDCILKRFQTNETAVQVTQGKISALISESELIELQNSKATMYSKLGTVEMDISGLHGQFSDISSKYDAVTGQYSALDAKVAEYKAGLDGLSMNLTNLNTRINDDYSTTSVMNAAITAKVEELSGIVSNTYATQANLETEKGRITSLETWQKSASVKLTDNSIISTVTNSQSWKTMGQDITNLKTWKSQAELKITDSAIVSTVIKSSSWSSKADKDSLISQINQSAESISINASKINLNGAVTANNYFKILTDGSMECTGGKISGWLIKSDHLESPDGTFKLYGSGKLEVGQAVIDNNSNAVTIKYGLHVHVQTDKDGFYDGSQVFKIFGLKPVTGGRAMRISSSVVGYTASSSRRYKDYVRAVEEAEAEKLLQLPVIWFQYKKGYLSLGDRFAGKNIPGFFAEDAAEALPDLAVYENGKVEDWNYRTMIPMIVKILQMQDKKIKDLESKLAS